jgi:UDP-3-O-[3-hydroxymyristoyl] glucosamine N-acyltransferase
MITIERIIDFLKCNGINYNYTGKHDLVINDYSVPDNVRDDSILWIKDLKKLEDINLENYDNVLIVTSSLNSNKVMCGNFLVANNSKELFFSIINHFFAEQSEEAYIGSSSIVETNYIGKDVYIGHNCFISSKVKIGDNVVVKNNVVIEGTVSIGNNTTISSGVVIGSDGYGYYQNENGKNIKVSHLGGVVIGNDVEIGANTCIDRGTLGNTIIGDNVKIDNLCHIAHNVLIEDNVIVIALSMIAGSVVLKENSYIAPSASVMNQLTIGKNSFVGIGSVVVKEVDDNMVVAGVPAKVIRKKGDE